MLPVTRRSSFTGKVHTITLNVTAEQLAELASPRRRAVQDIVPHLSGDEREFLITGVTPEEWAATFGGLDGGDDGDGE